MNMRKTVDDILRKKKDGQRIVMLTAYDHPTAALLDMAGVDIILVGDSLANTVLGLKSTREVGMEQMLHHAGAVNRAVRSAMLVGDMPYAAYQEDIEGCVAHARRFIDEAGCQAVKLEWFDHAVGAARRIIDAGIPVMGHVGLTPQTAEKLGGFKVQGKDALSAQRIMDNARDLERAGCFSIVLECIPAELAAIMTRSLAVPTIGIGAGTYCDGQVLVIHDLLGFDNQFQPKFTKRYAELGREIERAVRQFCDEVRRGDFPDDQHSYHIKEEELKSLKVSR
jgi:3-methyl-2-oxobutanoate hydroxymethyltransferase